MQAKMRIQGRGPIQKWLLPLAVILSLEANVSSAGIIISGSVKSSTGIGIENVWIQASGTAGGFIVGDSVYTDQNGNYALALKNGYGDDAFTNWSGTVSLMAYCDIDGVPLPETAYVPKTRTYTNLAASLGGENFILTLQPRIIAGCITKQGRFMQGVVVALSSGPSTTTDLNGTYRFAVPYGWSGTITPRLEGHTFSPPSISYSCLTGNGGGDCVASQIMCRITGQVRSTSGVAMRGATIHDGRNKYAATTGSTGNYTIRVPYGWSGVLSAHLPGCAISPASRTYSNVRTSMPNQNFRASYLTISGYVRDPYGTAMSDVTLSANNGGQTVTNRRSGAYSLRVPPGWSGRVVADRWGSYEFKPSRRIYTALGTNKRAQNFTVAPYDRYMKAVGFKTRGGTAMTRTLGLGRSYNVTGLYGWKNFMGNADWQLVWSIDGQEFERITDRNQVNSSFVPTMEREITVTSPQYVPTRLGTHTIRFYVDTGAPMAWLDNNTLNDSITATFTVVDTPPPNLLVKPSARYHFSEAGRTTFRVTNTESGVRMRYAATESSSWLNIVSGAHGVNGGRVTVAFTHNPGTRTRTGKIKIEASGASGSPTYVKIIQYGNWTARNAASARSLSGGPRDDDATVMPSVSRDSLPARPSVWSRSALTYWTTAPELVDGDAQSIWIGDSTGPWSIALDFGKTIPLKNLDIAYANEPWTNEGILGTEDLLKWFDLGLITNWPISCRAIYFDFRDVRPGASPAIREIQWDEADPSSIP